MCYCAMYVPFINLYRRLCMYNTQRNVLPPESWLSNLLPSELDLNIEGTERQAPFLQTRWSRRTPARTRHVSVSSVIRYCEGKIKLFQNNLFFTLYNLIMTRVTPRLRLFTCSAYLELHMKAWCRFMWVDAEVTDNLRDCMEMRELLWHNSLQI